MLKKLFISLIILSALTSDTSAFSAFMLSAGLSPACWLNQLEESRILPEAAKNSYIKAADEIVQSHTVQNGLVFILPDSISQKCANTALYSLRYVQTQLTSIDAAFSSGTSPPFC